MTPAELLEGTVLPGDWQVTKLIPKGVYHTGGNFSAQYFVENRDGREAFLKAIDLSHALSQRDTMRALKDAIDTFTFERELLDLCRQHRLTRIVSAIHHGEIGSSLDEKVYFLLFELAEGDIRQAIRNMSHEAFTWKCNVLHEVAVGLKQLHDRNIAHQDLKPSNILTFSSIGTKLADLGRAYSSELPAPHDSLPCAGDLSYAPPELLYRYTYPDRMRQRLNCDVYLLGSMIFWLFTGQGLTRQLLIKLHPSQHYRKWRDTYEKLLPSLRSAFSVCLEELTGTLPPSFQADMRSIAASLCDPDPTRRNALSSDPTMAIRALNLQRVITRFDLLAKRSEIQLRN